MITRFEEDDKTLKKFFGTNNSIIPLDIGTVRRFNSPNFVLFNNNCLSESLTIRVEYEEKIKLMHLVVNCNFKFKVFLYYTTQICETLIPIGLKKSFVETIESLKKEIMTVELTLKQKQDEIQALKSKKENSLETLKSLKVELKNLENQETKQNHEMAKLKEKWIESIKEYQDFLNSVSKTEEYCISRRIMSIFSECNLKTYSIEKSLRDIDNFVELNVMKNQ